MIENLIEFRASGAAPLFSGDDGLTEAQQKKYDELSERSLASITDPKKKLTDNMKAEFDKLHLIRTNLENGVVELSTGGRTFVESLVDQVVYKYKKTFGSKETEKGTKVEVDAIEFLNDFFMLDMKKSDSSLSAGHFRGHPDLEDGVDKMITDIKCSWSKDTFPKLPEHISNGTYEWQLKMYCYMKSKMTGEKWSKARLCYVLMSTPEGLVPDWEGDDLHYVDDLDPALRITYIEFELTDADIAHIERREKAAVKYAKEYYNKLITKNQIK
jgi:hypothetical protein